MRHGVWFWLLLVIMKNMFKKSYMSADHNIMNIKSEQLITFLKMWIANENTLYYPWIELIEWMIRGITKKSKSI